MNCGKFVEERQLELSFFVGNLQKRSQTNTFKLPRNPFGHTFGATAITINYDDLRPVQAVSYPERCL